MAYPAKTTLHLTHSICTSVTRGLTHSAARGQEPQFKKHKTNYKWRAKQNGEYSLWPGISV